jgi:hypothetical protein
MGQVKKGCKEGDTSGRSDISKFANYVWHKWLISRHPHCMMGLVLATSRHGSRKSSNQFDLWRTEYCQDFSLKPHHFTPKLQTKISMRVLVRSARMFFYRVANFMRYKINKYQANRTRTRLRIFVQKSWFANRFVTTQRKSANLGLNLKSNPCSVRFVANTRWDYSA